MLDVTLTDITHIALRTTEVTEVVQSNPGASPISVLTYETAERASVVLWAGCVLRQVQNKNWEILNKKKRVYISPNIGSSACNMRHCPQIGRSSKNDC